jgi:hypothetical protein
MSAYGPGEWVLVLCTKQYDMLNNFRDLPSSIIFTENESKTLGNLVMELNVSFQFSHRVGFHHSLSLVMLTDLLDACCDEQTQYSSHPPL